MYSDIIFTNPNWENEDTGEKSDEVLLHYTASSCDIEMQVEAISVNLDGETSDDPDQWTISWSG